MLKDKLFLNFVAKRPIAVAFQMVFTRLFAPHILDDLFANVAKGQYQRTLLFSTIVKVMASVVMSKHPSVNAAYKKMKDEIGVSLNAFYQKLERIEPEISRALVQHSYQQACEVRKQIKGIPHNDIPGYRTKIIDGNQIRNTEHRLLETRNESAAPLPGKSLVLLDPRFQAIIDFIPIEDGHAQERSAFGQLLATFEANDLIIADRNFCTYQMLTEIAQKKAAFVIRHHASLNPIKLGTRKKVGTTATGDVYERKMKLSNKLTVRRIEVELTNATRDGDELLVIVTNLSEAEANAVKVAELYRDRWKIETAFQVLTTTMQCEINSLCYPKAALFTFALALFCYNVLAVVHGAIAKQHGAATDAQMSHYYMALEIAQTTDGMLVALPLERWRIFATQPRQEFQAALFQVLNSLDIDVYRKSHRGPKQSKRKRKKSKKPHVSTAKLLAQRKHSRAC